MDQSCEQPSELLREVGAQQMRDHDCIWCNVVVLFTHQAPSTREAKHPTINSLISLIRTVTRYRVVVEGLSDDGRARFEL
ncbi:MAG: hypothetical protein JWN04_3477 [Myxococcaceae bacterium]|nr:hypothetical protein [Myxococcaceae bacterium]